MSQSQFGASLGGPIVREPHVLLRQRRAAAARSDRASSTISTANVAAINARLAGGRLSGAAGGDRRLSEPGGLDQRARQGRSPGQRPRSVQRPLQPATTSTRSNSRGAGGLNAPSASAGARQPRPGARAQQHADALAADGARDARAVRARRPEGAADRSRSARRSASPASPRSGRCRAARPAASNTLYQIVNNLSHQAGAHALRAGVDFLYNDDRITFPRAVRGSYTFSSLANFLAGVYNNAGFTQTFGATDVSQTNPNVGVYAQDEWKVGPQLTLNAGLRYDLQLLETINTDANNVSPRLGFAWSPFDSRRTIVRGSAGLFYDRVPLRALANALLSAGNTTDLT